ncbi:MAG TPA: hypothetical protein VGN26_03875 [Armatimonadota bacterium]|jgi:phage-related protein
MASLAYQFGSYVYASNSAHVSDWQERIGDRGEAIAVPGSDRARETQALLGPREVTVSGRISASSAALWRSALDAFLAAHNPGTGYANLYRWDDRYRRACPVGLPTIGLNNRMKNTCTFEAHFRCPDPYLYAALASTDTVLTPAAGAPGHNVIATGTAEALPAYTLTIGVGGTGTIVLQRSSPSPVKSFTLTGTFTAGDVLVVDALAQTVTRNGANALSLLTAGSFFGLIPGSNNLVLTFAAPLTLASLITTWRGRYL